MVGMVWDGKFRLRDFGLHIPEKGLVQADEDDAMGLRKVSYSNVEVKLDTCGKSRLDKNMFLSTCTF